MIKILARTEESVTYVWFCPACLAENIQTAYQDMDRISCHNCSLDMMNVNGEWVRANLPI